jgi:hypothetical protein
MFMRIAPAMSGHTWVSQMFDGIELGAKLISVVATYI